MKIRCYGVCGGSPCCDDATLSAHLARASRRTKSWRNLFFFFCATVSQEILTVLSVIQVSCDPQSLRDRRVRGGPCRESCAARSWPSATLCTDTPPQTPRRLFMNTLFFADTKRRESQANGPPTSKREGPSLPATTTIARAWDGQSLLPRSMIMTQLQQLILARASRNHAGRPAGASLRLTQLSAQEAAYLRPTAHHPRGQHPSTLAGMTLSWQQPRSL